MDQNFYAVTAEPGPHGYSEFHIHRLGVTGDVKGCTRFTTPGADDEMVLQAVVADLSTRIVLEQEIRRG